MYDIFNRLINGFLLLRDVFGYVIPGTVVLGVFYYETASKIQQFTSDLPAWLTITILLVMCYIFGTILVAFGYLVYDVVDWIRKDSKRDAQDGQWHAEELDLLYYRYLYPSMFIDRDRRAIINIFRIGLAVALVAVSWVLPFAPVVFIIGLFMLYNGYTGRAHVGHFSASAIDAARRAETSNVPYGK